MTDALGQRMKEQYEDRTRYLLPRRTYTIIRVDGKAFHTFTRGFKRPFDAELMKLMDETAKEMAKQIQGCVLAYVQSDEISLLLTDFTSIQTNAWFDGNVQKMASIAASIATTAFNRQMLKLKTKSWIARPESEDFEEMKFAQFDARVFTIPDVHEVVNYFIWRQADATRNSIQMAAQSVYSQKELHGKNTNVLQEMLFQKGINWNDYTSGEKRGRLIVKEKYEIPRKEIVLDVENSNSPLEVVSINEIVPITRTRWISLDGVGGQNQTPQFTQDRSVILVRIPNMGENK